MVKALDCSRNALEKKSRLAKIVCESSCSGALGADVGNEFSVRFVYWAHAHRFESDWHKNMRAEIAAHLDFFLEAASSAAKAACSADKET